MTPYKTIRFTGTPEEIKAQWLDARKQGIGGSDAAGIIGQNKPYSTPYTVWLEKTGRIEAPDLSDKQSVHWGTILEDVVAKEFARLHPEMKVKKLNAMLQSREHPFMQASLDRTVDDDGTRGVLEIKTVGLRRAADWDDGIPDYYLPQVVHYMAVTGFTFAWVAVLIGGQEYREFRIERDEEDIEALIAAEERFWGYVTLDDAPPLLGGSGEAQALLDTSPLEDDDYLEVLDQDFPEVQDLNAITEEIKILETRKSELANTVKQRIGNHKGIKTPTWRVTWPRSEYQRFDSKRFRAENPDEYDRYTTTATRDGGLRFKEVE